MRRGVLAKMLLAAPVLLAAQPPEKPFRYNGLGYITYGIGTCQHRVTNVSVAGGGEGFLVRGLTLGTDLGYYRFVERNSSGWGAFEVTLGYHFVDRKKPKKLDPFVSVSPFGIAVGGCGCVAAAGSLAGGLNYWFKDKIGVRSEARIHVIARSEAIFAFRIGLSFR